LLSKINIPQVMPPTAAEYERIFKALQTAEPSTIEKVQGFFDKVFGRSPREARALRRNRGVDVAAKDVAGNADIKYGNKTSLSKGGLAGDPHRTMGNVVTMPDGTMIHKDDPSRVSDSAVAHLPEADRERAKKAIIEQHNLNERMNDLREQANQASEEADAAAQRGDSMAEEIAITRHNLLAQEYQKIKAKDDKIRKLFQAPPPKKANFGQVGSNANMVRANKVAARPPQDYNQGVAGGSPMNITAAPTTNTNVNHHHSPVTKTPTNRTADLMRSQSRLW